MTTYRLLIAIEHALPNLPLGISVNYHQFIIDLYYELMVGGRSPQSIFLTVILLWEGAQNQTKYHRVRKIHFIS